MQFGLREARHIGIVKNIGTMLVIVAVRDTATNFMQLRSPLQFAQASF